MGLVLSTLGVLVVFFAAIRTSCLMFCFVGAAALYGSAILTWSTGCHDKIESSLINGFTGVGFSVINVNFEYGIGFGSIISAGISSFATTIFLCCTPRED